MVAAMEIESIDYDIFMLNVLSHVENNNERTGQAYMNSLYELAPNLYAEVVGTSTDCFFDNDKIRFLLEKIFWYFVF